jgi:hypothetical protein
MFGAIVLASSVFIPGAGFASTSLTVQEARHSRPAPASVFEPFDFYQEGGELRLVDTRLRQHGNAFTMDRARYKARMTSYLGAGAAIHYQHKNHSLAFIPRGLSWSGNGEAALGIRRLPNRVPARLVAGDELEGAGGSRLAGRGASGRGVIYENAYGEGLHLGALAKKTVLRKLVRFDSLEALGQIPNQAEFLQLAFELRTEGDTYFKAGFDDEHPYRWDERDTLVADGIPVEFGRGSERSFMLPAHAWDSTGRKITIRLELRREAQDLLLVKMIPVDWLARADFPVYADVDLTFGAEFIFEWGNTEWVSMASLDADHVVIAYQDVDSSGAGTAVVGTITGETIAFGTPVPFLLTEARNISVTALDSTHVLIAYQDVANSNYGTAIVGTVSGNAIAFNGSAAVFEFSNTVLIERLRHDCCFQCSQHLKHLRLGARRDPRPGYLRWRDRSRRYHHTAHNDRLWRFRRVRRRRELSKCDCHPRLDASLDRLPYGRGGRVPGGSGYRNPTRHPRFWAPG